jgi:hypothetical protein
MLKKALLFGMLSCFSLAAYSEQQHHNLAVNTCRALPAGDLQIVGISEADNQSRSIIFSATAFREKVVDRYLSFCLMSLAAGSKLRIGYLDCTGTVCTTTGGTSLNAYK